MGGVSLLADGGKVTVLRRLAGFVWGRWQVTYPEGFVVPSDQQLQHDREYGFVAKLSEVEPPPFGRRFARRDVLINAPDQVSTVEENLDDAARLTKGDVFLEWEIGPGGLGRLVPWQDFRVGDVVNVRIWGFVLRLPVTNITAVTDVQGGHSWSVHVGGQLVEDSRGRSARNLEVLRAIQQERREVAKEAGAAGVSASQASSSAAAASGSASQARQSVVDAEVQREAAERARNEAEVKRAAAETARQRAEAARAEMVEQLRLQHEQHVVFQAQRDRDQDSLLQQLRDIQGRVSRERPGLVLLGSEDDFVRVDNPFGAQLRVRCKGSWQGRVVAQAVGGSSGSGTNLVVNGESTTLGLANREFVVDAGSGSLQSGLVWYFASEGTPVEISHVISGMVPQRNQLTRVAAWFAPRDGVHACVQARVGWDSASFHDAYDVQIRVGGRVVAEDKARGLGPIFPGLNGYATKTVVADSLTIGRGQAVEVWVQTSHEAESGRRIRGGALSGFMLGLH